MLKSSSTLGPENETLGLYTASRPPHNKVIPLAHVTDVRCEKKSK